MVNCFFCGKEDAINKCVKCKKAWFCNKECQKKGWKEHKSKCSELYDSIEEENNFNIAINNLKKSYDNRFSLAIKSYRNAYFKLENVFNIQVDYSNDLRAIFDQEDVIQDNNKRFNSYLADNYQWYLEWSSNLNCNQDCMSFIRSDKRFDGMLALYSYEKTVIYQGRLEDFRDNLNINLSRLRQILKNK